VGGDGFAVDASLIAADAKHGPSGLRIGKLIAY
jgi:hypothetical protein